MDGVVGAKQGTGIGRRKSAAHRRHKTPNRVRGPCTTREGKRHAASPRAPASPTAHERSGADGLRNQLRAWIYGACWSLRKAPEARQRRRLEARPLKRKQGRTRGWRIASWAEIEGRACVEFGISLRRSSTQTHRSRWDGATVTSRTTSNKARNGFGRAIESRHEQTQEGLRLGVEKQVNSVSCKASGLTHQHVNQAA